MLKIQSFIANPIEENCFVVSDEATGEACIIDCGCFVEGDWQSIKSYIDENELRPVQLLCTHCHFDHVLGAGMANRDYNLSPRCAEEDRTLYENMTSQLSLFGVRMDLSLPPLGETLKEGDIITLGNHSLRVIATPGHTQGGVCFYSEEDSVLFSGDTLFFGSVGRTDLPGGDTEQLISSIQEKLMILPEETTVYCGHGPKTMIGREKRNNPYL